MRRLAVAAKHHGINVTAEPLERGNDPRPLLGVERPDVAQELQVDPFRASFGHVRTHAPITGRGAPHRPAQATQHGIIEPQHRIGARQAQIETAVVVAVHDPPLAGRQFRQLRAPFRPRRLHPARPPEFLVEMDERQSRRVCQRRENVLLPAPEMPITRTRCMAFARRRRGRSTRWADPNSSVV